MNSVLGIKISKQLEKLIKERVMTTNEPYVFKIVGVTGFGNDRMSSAHSTLEKLKKWAEREGAEVTLFKDKYKEILDEAMKNRSKFASITKTSYKGQSKGYLLVEITDPAARIIEYLLQN